MKSKFDILFEEILTNLNIDKFEKPANKFLTVGELKSNLQISTSIDLVVKFKHQYLGDDMYDVKRAHFDPNKQALVLSIGSTGKFMSASKLLLMIERLETQFSLDLNSLVLWQQLDDLQSGLHPIEYITKDNVLWLDQDTTF